MPEPILTTVIAALVAGATAQAGKVASQAISDAYDGLKALIVRKLGGKTGAVQSVEDEPESEEAQALAKRHVDWLTGVPGTPASALRQAQGPNAEVKAYVTGLGEMYVADPRFGANYATADGSTRGAEFVRDALRIYAEANL